MARVRNNFRSSYLQHVIIGSYGNKGDPIDSGGACKAKQAEKGKDGLMICRKSDWLIVLWDGESPLHGKATSGIWIQLVKH